MREQWEIQEEENKDKEFVHYQDVLFDEARTHGVSYFKFSTDAEERLKQQKELDTERKATLEAQKERDEQRAAREQIIAERVLAAKNRQRARLGLPPLEKEEQTESNPTTESESRNPFEKTERDEAAELEKKTHLRPWDEGKEGTSHLVPKEAEWTYKGHKEPMSQEQWNEKKRGERNSEFAPTEALNKSPKKRENYKHTRDINSQVDKSKNDFVQERYFPPPPEMEMDQEEEEDERKGLYFTTKKKLKRRNYQAEEPEEVPRTRSGGAEVPPPPTFDYYGPPVLGLNKKAKPEANKNQLSSSIEAGLKFLRDQTDKGQSTSGSLWGANANYGKE